MNSVMAILQTGFALFVIVILNSWKMRLRLLGRMILGMSRGIGNLGVVISTPDENLDSLAEDGQ